jgi:hypothetical protein
MYPEGQGGMHIKGKEINIFLSFLYKQNVCCGLQKSNDAYYVYKGKMVTGAGG